METSFIEDTINFTLQSSKVVVSDTVRISVTISASANSTTSETDLRADIKLALDTLIPGATWDFSGMSRSRDQAGLELVQVNATTRVNEKENYKLGDRARKASREGLTLGEPVVDNSVPGPKLELAEKELRQIILKKITEEIEAIKETLNVGYRIGSVSFSNMVQAPKHQLTAMAMNASYSTSVGAGIGMSDDADSLSNSQRVSLTATIQLCKLYLVNKLGK